MKTSDLEKLGVPNHPKVMKAAFSTLGRAFNAMASHEVKRQIRTVCTKPDQWVGDVIFGALAQEIVDLRTVDVPENRVWSEREGPAPWTSWGQDLDKGSIQQMRDACRLPVAVRGALMPNAHTGYGLPIGGVLATEGAVIPFGVGVDISCSMSLTVTDIPVHAIRGERDRLIKTLEAETSFGMGAQFDTPRDHEILDADGWNVAPIVKRQRQKAVNQLGSSGGGNHFVEYGVATFFGACPEMGIEEAGDYVAIMSHSGSRGPGATLADHYTKLAMAEHPELPKELRYLAWLSTDTDQGLEYWFAMNLMGEYAEACHRVIHARMLKSLGAKALSNVYNRHNFAWVEEHFGRRLIVHRKGATPAEAGQMGIIPGSMAHPAYIVRGRGQEESLCSASHGAGRKMSRKEAEQTGDRTRINKFLREKEVTVLSAGMDENPFAYKDIDEVMALQTDLVDPVARFQPRIVKMAPADEQKAWQKYTKRALSNLKGGG